MSFTLSIHHIFLTQIHSGTEQNLQYSQHFLCVKWHFLRAKFEYYATLEPSIGTVLMKPNIVPSICEAPTTEQKNKSLTYHHFDSLSETIGSLSS